MCVCVWIHTYIRTCIHTFIHTYIHTYIHIHAHRGKRIRGGRAEAQRRAAGAGAVARQAARVVAGLAAGSPPFAEEFVDHADVCRPSS